MTEENKPSEEAFTTAQPKIDANQAGASEGYGEGAIQILEGFRAFCTDGCEHQGTGLSIGTEGFITR